MKNPSSQLVKLDGRLFTVWTGDHGPVSVTTDARHTRMGFRHLPLTSRLAKAAIAAAQLAELKAAAREVLAAFGGDVPDWIRAEAARLEAALGSAPYNHRQIAWELERTAKGDGFYGNALRVAKDIPGVTAEERSLLDRYATGQNKGTDHVAMQQLALRIYSGSAS